MSKMSCLRTLAILAIEGKPKLTLTMEKIQCEINFAIYQGNSW